MAESHHLLLEAFITIVSSLLDNCYYSCESKAKLLLLNTGDVDIPHESTNETKQPKDFNISVKCNSLTGLQRTDLSQVSSSISS